MSRHAYGGGLRKGLTRPDIRRFAVDVRQPGAARRSDTAELGKYLAEVVRLNDPDANFRIVCADEMVSNRLSAVFEATPLQFVWPTHPRDEWVGRRGRVLEILSEQHLPGMASRYLLTGRHGLFPCYEAFVAIVDSMMAQYAKLLKQAAEVPWRKPVSSGSRSADITTARPEPEHRMSFRTLRASHAIAFGSSIRPSGSCSTPRSMTESSWRIRPTNSPRASISSGPWRRARRRSRRSPVSSSGRSLRPRPGWRRDSFLSSSSWPGPGCGSGRPGASVGRSRFHRPRDPSGPGLLRGSARNPQERPWAHGGHEPAARPHPPSTRGRAEGGDAPARLAGSPPVGLLLGRRDVPGRQQRGQGVQAWAQGCRPPASLHPARPPPHLRLAPALGPGQSGLRPAAARPRFDQAHGRYLGRWLPIGNKAAIDGLDDEETIRTVRDPDHSPEVGP